MRYEWKKIFSKLSNKAALLFLIIFTLFSVKNANYLVWINEDNTELTGSAAAEKIRGAEEEWSGPLTEEKIARAIEVGWSQGNRGIRMLLAKSYGGIDNTDSTIVNSLRPEDAANFYINRITSLKEWLKAQGGWYTEKEQNFLVQKYEALETPLEYEYARGWTQLFNAAPSLQMVILLAAGFLVSGVFSEEYRTGASSIYFSSVLGRGKATGNKIKAGILLITAIYWACFGLFSLLVLFRLGFGGAGCMIQTSSMSWRSFYNITYFQEYLLIAFGGYAGCLFADSLAMLVSAKTKSTVVSVIVPFVVIFAPSVIRLASSPLAEKISGLMPYQLVQMNSVISRFYLYPVFGSFVGAAGLLLPVYLLLTAVLCPVMYAIFRRG